MIISSSHNILFFSYPNWSNWITSQMISHYFPQSFLPRLSWLYSTYINNGSCPYHTQTQIQSRCLSLYSLSLSFLWELIFFSFSWRRKWQPALVWKISWTEEPGGLQTMGSQRVGMTERLALNLFSFSRTAGAWPR